LYILDYFQELRWPIHLHTTQMVRFKSSRSMSLQGCGNSCSEDCVSDVPLQYSNWEMLVSLSVPLIFWWRCLDTLMVWSFALKWRRQHGGRWGFAFHVFLALLDYIRKPHLHSNWLERCLFSISVSRIFLLLRMKNRSALVQVMGSAFPGCWG